MEEAIRKALAAVAAAVAAEPAPVPPMTPAAAAREAETTALADAEEAALSVFGRSGHARTGRTRTAGTRPPTDAERAAARGLSRALTTAGRRDRTDLIAQIIVGVIDAELDTVLLQRTCGPRQYSGSQVFALQARRTAADERDIDRFAALRVEIGNVRRDDLRCSKQFRTGRALVALGAGDEAQPFEKLPIERRGFSIERPETAKVDTADVQCQLAVAQ